MYTSAVRSKYDFLKVFALCDSACLNYKVFLTVDQSKKKKKFGKLRKNLVPKVFSWVPNYKMLLNDQ